MDADSDGGTVVTYSTNNAIAAPAPPADDNCDMKNDTNGGSIDLNTVNLVDSWPVATLACERIKAANFISLDMEGAPLETVSSLLQIAVSESEIYVFDLLALGQRIFDATHLLPILSNPCILKLCYDCRGDACALFFQHGVQLQGVYDLQIVFTSLFQHHTDPFLKGLHRAVERLERPDVSRTFTERKLALKRLWSAEGLASSLLERPLTPEALAYAAADVVYLLRMFRDWAPYVSQRAILNVSANRVHYFVRARAIHLHNRKRHQDNDETTKTRALVGGGASPMSRIDFAPVRSHRPRFLCQRNAYK